ncbi:RHS repeat-associated core domain-containing protein [[Pseudomonas] boreopolis]|uniref:Type IV secretion protein Rhs n=1 Tax=Xanthomonas boreopolis TaxID=86183 RepID=A0A919F6U3_9XANT|nr:type IV secretion protein Rhs [[Pseudomonas] boreopolis]
MSIAAKHFDPQLGIDIHMYAMPPCPLPTPHIGLVLDPFDYLPFIGSTVKVGGVHRATAGTGGLDIHIPLGAWAPPMAAPMGPQFDGEEIFMGSRTVSADGEPFSRLAMPVLDCNLVGLVVPFRRKKPKKPLRALSLPTGLNVAIPTNVTVGGPPTVSWTALAFRGLFAGLGKLRKASFVRKKLDAFANWRRAKWGNLPPGFLKCKVLRAEPVDIRDGSVSVTHEDFSIPGRLPLPWRRVYSSREAAHAGSCGHGWQTPADIRLQLSADGSAWLSGPDEAALFPQLPAGDGMAHHVLDFVDGARLYREGVHLLVRFKDGRRYRFEHAPAPGVAVLPGDRTLPIARIEDACGNHWRFERRDGHLVRIVESGIDGLQGRFIEVEARQGRIERLQLHDPATGLNHPLVSYRYADGDLVAALDALDAARTFEYRQHRMVRHTDRVGLSFHYAYDAQWRVVHSWGDGGLYDYRFEYDDLLRETRLTDSLGHATVVKFDEHRLPLCEIDPLDGVTVFEYDDFGRTVAVTDPEGLRTGFEYDERGNLCCLIRADGTTLRMEHDEHDGRTVLHAPDGSTWKQQYDELGRLVAQIDPLGAITRYEYDAYGQVIAQADARNAATRLRYDRHGLVAAVVDALGCETAFEHDAWGNLLRYVDPLGQVSRYEYDAKGRLLASTGPDGASVHCEYDAEDQLVCYIDETGARTRLQYVGIGQIGRRLQADGQVLEYRYDTEEQLVAVINQRSEIYRLVRDPLGRIVEEVDYWGQSRRYGYDAAGRLAFSVDPLGQRITFVTDKLGRIVRKTLPDVLRPGRQVQEHFVYDKQGQLTELRNPARTVKRRYDPLGRLLEEVQDGFRVGYTYDEVGNCVLRETSAGNRVAFGYDLRGQVTSVAINGEPPISMERDALGRITCEQLSPELRREFAYDSRDLLISQRLSKGAVPLFETIYEHDRSGNLTRRSDSVQGADEYRYDAIGRLLQHMDPKGRLGRFFHDPAGDRLRTEVKQVQARKIVGGDDDLVAWTREGAYEGVHYVFDRSGDLVHKRGAHGTSPEDITLVWDANHRLVESRHNGQSTYYGYDPLGRRAFKRTSANTTWFFWDGDVLLGELRQTGDEARTGLEHEDGEGCFVGAKAKQSRLMPLHGRTREYVCYPGTFVPLALVAPSSNTVGRLTAAPLRSIPSGDVIQGTADRAPGPENRLGMIGATRLGAVDLPATSHMDVAPVGGPNLQGKLGRSMLLQGHGELQRMQGTQVQGSVTTGRQDKEVGARNALDTPGIAPPPALQEGQCKPVYHYHVDPNGCTVRMTDVAGSVVWEGRQEAWGSAPDSGGRIENSLRLQGQYFDVETGLSYNRYRYFDPWVGQFIGQDPLGLEAGENLYEFAVNPLGWIDPLGLSCRTTKKLQSFVDQAVRELIANPKMAKDLMSRGSYSHLQDAGSRLYAASFGKAVERRVAQLVRQDPNLRRTVIHTGLTRGSNGQFISSPDFTRVVGAPKVWDVTTNGAVASHGKRYGNQRVTYLVYDVVHGLKF